MTIDLRSDTVTKPTDGMRRAMADAEVGDDQYGEDPTVNRLQERAAELFGREAALLVPSGVMGNIIAMRTWAAPGTEVIVEDNAHLVAYEAGASAMMAGVQFRTLPGLRGQLVVEQVEAALRPVTFPYTANSAVSIENTTNRAGGTVYPIEAVRELRALAAERELRFYMDGARVLNAVVASGTSAADYGTAVDGLCFCLSKGLGAPVGSVLVGDADAIADAHGWRRRLGGAMRQAGIIAAAGLYALEHHVDRLADDHANARRLAEVVADAVPAAVDPDEVETNIVYIDTGDEPAAEIAERLSDDGILIGAMGATSLRAVTHLDVDRDDCETAAAAIATALSP
ncbi:MAG: GntG family PLP-dependent aldolase [Nitriliruptorales bacterium]|nr:GntG family PLP-dependent aldolase [Nitriliruptorales bacterium]